MSSLQRHEGLICLALAGISFVLVWPWLFFAVFGYVTGQIIEQDRTTHASVLRFARSKDRLKKAQLTMVVGQQESRRQDAGQALARRDLGARLNLRFGR